MICVIKELSMKFAARESAMLEKGGQWVQRSLLPFCGDGGGKESPVLSYRFVSTFVYVCVKSNSDA